MVPNCVLKPGQHASQSLREALYLLCLFALNTVETFYTAQVGAAVLLHGGFHDSICRSYALGPQNLKLRWL